MTLSPSETQTLCTTPFGLKKPNFGFILSNADFDSANFIMNALDYLTENDDLISLRGKNAQRRPLYKVENMRKANMYRYKLKENDIFRL